MSKSTFTLKRKLFSPIISPAAAKMLASAGKKAPVAPAARTMPKTSVVPPIKDVAPKVTNPTSPNPAGWRNIPAYRLPTKQPTTTTPTPTTGTTSGTTTPTTPTTGTTDGTTTSTPTTAGAGGFKNWWKARSGWGKAGIIGAGAIGLTVGAGALANAGLKKAGEQSDGSRMFSQRNNNKRNNMAIIYTLKRKTYSEEKQEKKSKVGRNLAIGAATIGTLALGARAGYRGNLGAGMQQTMGKLVGKTGKLVGNENWMKKGAQAYGQGRATELTSDLLKRKGAIIDTNKINAWGEKKGNQFLDNLTKK